MFGGSPSLSLRLTHSAEIFKDLQQKAATKQTAKIQPFFYIHLHDLVHLINMSDVLQPLIHKSLFLQEKPETTKMKFFLNVKQNLLPFSFVFPFFLPFFLLLSADLEALLLLFLLPLCDQMLGRRRVFAAASSEEEKGFSFFFIDARTKESQGLWEWLRWGVTCSFLNESVGVSLRTHFTVRKLVKHKWSCKLTCCLCGPFLRSSSETFRCSDE